MEVHTYNGLKYVAGTFSRVRDGLTVEEAIQISINGDPYTVTMRTPGKDRELVRGLLYSEDIYTRTDELFKMAVMDINANGEVTAVDVQISPEDLGPGYIPTRNVLSVSSCGICGKRELDDLTVKGEPLLNQEQLDPALINTMFQTMRSKQTAFDQSGGCHAAAAFTIQGQILGIEEDIGRHNAVDKVIGHLVLENKLEQAKCLLVSGRISYEIVTKAFVAGFPYLASVSAPSSLAVDYAEQLGITLLSFCRGDKATCYANEKGLIQENE